MAQFFWNNAEGLAPGTSLTAALSGGNNGVPFTSVTHSGTAAITADTTHGGAHGSQAYKIVTGTSFSPAHMDWNPTDGSVQQWFRMNLYLTANPGTATTLGYMDGAGAVRCSRLILNTAGTISMQKADATVAFTTTNTIPLNQWFRLEGYLLGDASPAPSR